MICPFCSAPVKPNWPTYPPEPQDGISWFTCGTMIHDAKPSRGDQTRLCVEGEVGGLKSRIAALEFSARALLDAINGDAEDITEAVDALRGAVEGKP
jgi:hypothetical protein